jgi:hypothetical protein
MGTESEFEPDVMASELQRIVRRAGGEHDGRAESLSERVRSDQAISPESATKPSVCRVYGMIAKIEQASCSIERAYMRNSNESRS